MESVHGVAKEALTKQDKKKSDNLWWTDEVEQLVGEKRTLYLKWLNTKSEEEKRIFIEKRNEVRRTVNAEKNKLWDKKCTEVNIYIEEEGIQKYGNLLKPQQLRDGRRCQFQ